MSVTALLDELEALGVELAVDGGDLSIRAPQGTLTRDHQQRMVAQKAALVDVLQTRSRPGALIARPESRHEPFPLSSIQQAYWVGRHSGWAKSDVACYVYREFAAPGLDVARLARAWQALIDRHDMLRAVILPDGRQKVLPGPLHYDLAVLDLRQASSEARDRQLDAVRQRMAQQVLPTDQWPLFDIRATLLPDGEVRVHVGFDLLIADAASLLLLYQEWRQLYEQPDVPLPRLDLTFRDYRLAEESLRQTPRYRRDEHYWASRTLPPAPALPLARAPESLERLEFRRLQGELDAESWSRLRSRAKEVGVTPSSLLAAVFGEVLSLWSSSRQFTLVLTFFQAQPLHPQVRQLVGDFTSTLLVEVDGRPETFTARAQGLHEQIFADLDHALVSGVDVARLAAQSGEGAGQSFPVVFTSALSHGGGEAESPFAWLGETRFTLTQTPQVWLDHHVLEEGGRLVYSWDRVVGLFPDGLVDDMFAFYERQLRDLLADDNAWTRSWRRPLTPEALAERVRYNATDAPVSEALLHDLFLARVAEQPGHPAVVGTGFSLSYGELHERATRVACALLARGTAPGELVAVVLEKGWEPVAAVLGVLYAGAVYVPIDPDLPDARRHHLLARIEASRILTSPELDVGLAWPEALERLTIGAEPSTDAALELTPRRQPEDLAYVIFTSGSSGEPKGVMIDHRGAVNTCLDINQRFDITARDRILGVSALTFDLSVWDVFGVLGAGGTLVLPEPALERDPEHWARQVADFGVTVWNSVPASLHLLLQYLEGADQALPESLRLALLSGDWIPLDLPPRLWARAPGARLFSLGGATEASIWSIVFPVDAVDPSWKSIPYGRPLANQTIHVLDENLEPCPAWVPGRLYIGGLGVALGYWGAPELTAERFFRHPETGERLYHTGDLGRFRGDGVVEFLGREDHQVKIQGFRIELGEIEKTLAAHADVAEAAVVAVGDPMIGRRLVAHLVAGTTERAFRPRRREETIQDPAERLEFQLAQQGRRRVKDAPKTVRLVGHGDGHGDRGAVLALLERRRTVRAFSPAPLAFEALAGWLAVLRQRGSEDLLPRYTYPSAGHLYPVQTYLHCQDGRIPGLDGGLYLYRPEAHDLVLLDPGDLDRSLHAVNNQPIFDGAAFTLFLVGCLPAIQPLYGELARDFCLLEAGYASQNLMLAGLDAGIGLCAVGDLDFERIRPRFGFDDGHVLLHTLLGGPIPEGREGDDEDGAAVDDAAVDGAAVEGAAVDEASNPLDFGQGSNEALIARVLKFVRDRLPAYMVPSQVVVHEALPLNRNGKIDRKALATEAVGGTESAEAGALETGGTRRPTQAAPSGSERSRLETALQEMLTRLLGLDEVGPHTNFFQLGATSVHIVQLRGEIETRLGQRLPMTDLFNYPTLYQLAQHLGSTAEPSGSSDLETRARPRQARRRSRRTARTTDSHGAGDG